MLYVLQTKYTGTHSAAIGVPFRAWFLNSIRDIAFGLRDSLVDRRARYISSIEKKGVPCLGAPSRDGRGSENQVRKVCPYRNGTYNHSSIVESSLDRVSPFAGRGKAVL